MLRQIGKGISCEVYLAEHKKLQNKCAIKCIRKEQNSNRNFLKEIEFLINLKSIYVPVVYDYEEDDQYWYLIEEYMSGQSLQNLKQNQGVISQDELVDIAIYICEAFLWLHGRKPYPLLYLDLKPEHIFLTREGIKLIDFGAAVYLKGSCVSGTVMGTKGFASPEQLLGKNIDVRSDIYSIGAVLYWLMTNQTAPDEDETCDVKGYSHALTKIVRKCLRTDKAVRYPGVQALWKDLQCVKKKRSNKQLPKSLKIAIIGSQRGIGVTHFAIGLGICCNKMGISCLYEEKNESGAIQEMLSNIKDSREQNGICYFSGFAAVPKYGQAVLEENYGEKWLLRDYGSDRKEAADEYDEADYLIAVVGAKKWELWKAEELIERYRKRRNVCYMLRAGGYAEFCRLKKELKLTGCFYMPCYANPFSLGKKEQYWYRLLLKYMIKEQRGSVAGEKILWQDT